MESGMYRQRSRNLDLVKLDSCFGGLAIYKYAMLTSLFTASSTLCHPVLIHRSSTSTVCRSNAIEHCDYAYRYSEPPYMLDCEHVLFNKCSMEKNAARIVTNMNMYECARSRRCFDMCLSDVIIIMQEAMVRPHFSRRWSGLDEVLQQSSRP